VRRLVILMLLLGVVPAMPAQSASLAMTVQGSDPQFGRRRNQTSPTEEQVERDQMRARNKERQEQLKQDTDKLLELATELKQYVDKTNENILSVDVIKKADEIEKLAKSVREKMKKYELPPEPVGPAR
jgi:hypothetical protein